MISRKAKRSQESGVALIVALLALLLITAIIGGMMIMSKTETNISANFKDEQIAFFAARAGLEELRDRMRATSPAPITLPATKPGTASGVLYIRANTSIDPTDSSAGNIYVDDEICSELGLTCPALPGAANWATMITSNAIYQPSQGGQLAYAWVRVNLKLDRSAGTSSTPYYVDGNSANASNYVCWNGSNEVTSASACTGPPYPVFVVTALAITPSGSRRMVQYELVRNHLKIPPLPSALALDGTAVAFGTPHSNNFVINGQDAGNCDPTHALNASVGDVSAAGKTAVDTGMFRTNKLEGSNGATPAAYTTGIATDQVLSAAQLTGLQTVGDLDTLATLITNNADNVLDPSHLPTPMPSLTNQITVITGDTSICTGSGILLVTGTLTCSGNNSWDGIIFVIGTGSLQGNGGGNGAFTGAILIAQTRDALGTLLNTSSIPPTATFGFNGGGGNGITYNSCSIQNASYGSGLPYQQISFREIMR